MLDPSQICTSVKPELIPAGIEDLALYVPSLYLDLPTLAGVRGIEPEKLTKGLGLSCMGLTDIDEDAATMAAEAILRLVHNNSLLPSQIGRIYLGTESALDGSKPTATYVLGMLESALATTHGPRCLRHCDVVDLTFACIGATDAFQNCLDYVRVHPEQYAIAVASDVARYDLGSTGEYTQGAGAIAILVKANPALATVDPVWGVATAQEHDFFKPRRVYAKSTIKSQLAQHLASLNGQSKGLLEAIWSDPAMPWSHEDAHLEVFLDTPVFDGPYSNQCYTRRAQEALEHFQELHDLPSGMGLFDRWKAICFHLPYAAHARRIGVELYVEALKAEGTLEEFLASHQIQALPDHADDKMRNAFLKQVSTTPAYVAFVKNKLDPAAKASSLTGNLYTASVWLALMSTLTQGLEEDHLQNGDVLGMVAYGSGAKSKVFEIALQKGWSDRVNTWKLFQQLHSRTAVNFETYLGLHTGSLTERVGPAHQRNFFRTVGPATALPGQKTYAFELVSVEAEEA